LELNLDGEVLLDVTFPASGGEVHVNRIVKGLGHGLDEAATRAAQQIKFKPAISNGRPVDFPAVIHIVFQWRTDFKRRMRAVATAASLPKK